MRNGRERDAGERAASRARGVTRGGLAAFACCALAVVVAGPAPAAEPTTALRVSGMTFVGSREGEREILLRAQRAVFRPKDNTAELDDVSAVVTEPGNDRSFSMTCAHVELDVDSQDFRAEGDVRGQTGDGQRYAAPWVRYEHEQGLLLTDAPVQMDDDTGSFRGDGFRYYIEEHRFELLGNVRVEQHP